MSRLAGTRARGERGFTLVEVIVSAALLAVGLLGLISVLDSSRDTVSASERRETALHRAELEIEKARAFSYANVALPTPPSSSADLNDPRYHVQTGGTPGYRWDQFPTLGSYAPLVIDSSFCATNTCLDLQSNWQDGRLTGQVHRFVTWVDDPTLAGTTDMKRVTVAVTVAQGPQRPPTVVSTIVRNGS